MASLAQNLTFAEQAIAYTKSKVDAVWCDPWQCRTVRAFAITDLVAGRVRNLDAIYKLNTAELIGAGKPVSFYRVG